MPRAGKSISAAIAVLTCVSFLSGCKEEKPALMPVSAFTIGLEEGAGRVFSEISTTFSIKYSDPEFILPETLNQHILKHTNDEFTSTVVFRTGLNPDLKKGSPGQYLDATRYLDTGNPAIKEKAAAFRNSPDPVRDISWFVYNHITDKKTGIPMIPASIILKDRTGDCTEHSILTAALLRANGIPARCVVGAILTGEFGGRKDVFVYHMWTEAWFRGKWVFVDSTRPDDLNPNRYIAFAYHSLASEMPLDYMAALSSLTDIEIRRVR